MTVAKLRKRQTVKDVKTAPTEPGFMSPGEAPSTASLVGALSLVAITAKTCVQLTAARP